MCAVAARYTVSGGTRRVLASSLSHGLRHGSRPYSTTALRVNSSVRTSSSVGSQQKRWHHSDHSSSSRSRNWAVVTSSSVEGEFRKARKKQEFVRLAYPLQDTVVAISGASSKTARTAISLVLREQGKVVALSGQPQIAGEEHPHLQHVKIDRSRMDDSEYVEAALNWGLTGLKVDSMREMIGINLIGGAVPHKGESLRQLNVDKPWAFAVAVEAVGKEKAAKTSFGHVSSVAATILSPYGADFSEYGVLKDEIDHRFAERLTVNGNVIVLRPGLVLPNPTLEGRVHMGHEWSPEQMAHMPFLVLIGSGDQIQQPVGEECLYKAMLNGLTEPGSTRVIADAVGSEALTQKGLFTYFNKRASFSLHVPYRLAHYVADNYPLGRVAPYSTRMMEVLETEGQELDGQKFKELHKGHCKGISDVYPSDEIVIARGSPLGAHAGMIAKTIITDPRKFFGLVGNGMASLHQWDISHM